MLKTFFWSFLSAEAVVGAFLTPVLLFSSEMYHRFMEPGLLGIGTLCLVIALLLKGKAQSLEESLANNPASLLMLSTNRFAVGVRKLRVTVAQHRVSIQWLTVGIVLLLNAWLLSSLELGSGV
jgi:hypothetical protein